MMAEQTPRSSRTTGETPCPPKRLTGETSDPPKRPKAEKLIVTIDGPAGTGKSTAGRCLARRLGLEFLDTGAMYRAATAIVIDSRVDSVDERVVADTVAAARLRFDWTSDPPTLLSHGAPMTDRLRDADVAELISTLAGQAPLRAVMVELQREIARRHPRLVTEGRDQGSVVFPDASVKIYLHAASRVRATRRARQMQELGREADTDAIERELIERDRKDSSRAVAPLVRPSGAIDVDTSEVSFEESIDLLESIVLAHCRRDAFPGATGANHG